MPNESCLDKIRMARIKLLLQHPFFGNMATRLKLVCDNTMSTAATDGRNFFYNEEFIMSLNKEEMLFLFGHEVLHNVFEHHYRREKRNPLIWNVACDYVINLILKESKVGSPPSIKKGGVLLDVKYKNMHAEEVYDLLVNECMSEEKLNSLVDRLLDEHPDYTKNKSSEEIEEIKRELKENLLSSSQVCAGNIPSGIERYIKNLTEPKINWKDLLRQEIASTYKTDYTFFRTNKKSNYNNGFIIPGSLKTNGLEIVIAMDMSGSISDEIVSEFLSEISGIVSQFDDYNIDIWSFDTKVYNHESYRNDSGCDVSEYKPKGGGGTSFECNWEYMKENSISPKLFIMFTDMMPYDGWGDPTYCDTIFVSRGNRSTVAPFGLTVCMD
jgi:predicted metal-dependent peptidase